MIKTKQQRALKSQVSNKPKEVTYLFTGYTHNKSNNNQQQLYTLKTQDRVHKTQGKKKKKGLTTLFTNSWLKQNKHENFWNIKYSSKWSQEVKISLDTKVHLRKFFINLWFKIKKKKRKPNNWGSLKTQVSDHKKQEARNKLQKSDNILYQ